MIMPVNGYKIFNEGAYLEKVDMFLQKMDLFNDGKASERVVDRIIAEINR
jgi:hypothetical protein